MGRTPKQPGVAGQPSPIERVLQDENGLGAEILHALDWAHRALERNDEQEAKKALRSMFLAWRIVANLEGA